MALGCEGSEMNFTGAKLLLVDDQHENLDVLIGVLEPKGYGIVVALNGAVALDLARRVSPDLILLDVMMPEMNGFETCKRLKADPETRDIPVVFLTAKVELDDIVKGFELGAVDYVVKPFRTSELLSRIETHLELKFGREKLAGLADKLSRYLSPQIYDSIFSGERDVKIEYTRKPITVFFSDIVGFTPRTEHLDPHELARWLNTYLNEMAGIAIRYEGTLDKFIGDAVMVFFGDPQTHGPEEDAARCIRMALEMQAHAKKLGIEVRMGISSGECTVGNFGSDDRMEYTIIGREVNVAARLEENSEAGKILISETTCELVKDTIPCNPRGEIHVRGIDRSLMTYWVAGGMG